MFYVDDFDKFSSILIKHFQIIYLFFRCLSGVMSARGILQNPALFSGYDKTPVSCIEEWVNLSLASGLHFTCFHHHLVFMVEKVMDKASRRVFNCLNSTSSVLDYLVEYFGIKVPTVFDSPSDPEVGFTSSAPSLFPIKECRTNEKCMEDYLEDSCNLYVN